VAHLWLGSKCRKRKDSAVSNCIDLGQLLHLEPLTHKECCPPAAYRDRAKHL
jgi:hypothetical protein